MSLCWDATAEKNLRILFFFSSLSIMKVAPSLVLSVGYGEIIVLFHSQLSFIFRHTFRLKVGLIPQIDSYFRIGEIDGLEEAEF